MQTVFSLRLFNKSKMQISKRRFCTYGFNRPEMLKESCLGTVKFHESHIMICAGKQITPWPSKIENCFDQDFYGRGKFVRQFISTANQIFSRDQLMITVCDEIPKYSIVNEEGDLGTDIFIYPHYLKLHNLYPRHIPEVLEALRKDKIKSFFNFEDISTEKRIYVCSHLKRDIRCGVCGPELVEKFDLLKAESDNVFINQCSHLGCHKYAGNVITFPSGDWFGWVSPPVVSKILEYVNTGSKQSFQELFKDHYRGRLGLTQEEQKKILLE